MSNDTPEVSELDALKAQATELGIKFNPNIGIDKLRNKVQAAEDAAAELSDLQAGLTKEPEPEEKGQEEKVDDEDAGPKIARSEAEVAEALPKLTAREQFAIKKRRASEMVRINVSCMNPNKKDWEGELISVGSPRLGTFKKFVQFNTENGYHVPRIIYETLKERKCQIFHTIKDSRGNKSRKGKLVNEFSIEVLPKLTPDELQELASQQALAGSID